MELQQIFASHTGQPINKWTHYFPIYETHLARFRNRRGVMIEIGTGHGGSSRMWRSYLGPAFQIVSLDIRPECRDLESEQIAMRTGSQADPDFLSGVVREFGPPDIVLDDGSHMMSHIHDTFRHLYPQMARDGVYMVEDLHTAYWSEYGGGLDAPGSFFNVVRRLIDEMHQPYSRGAVAPTYAGANTRGIHIYDSVAVFDHGQYLRRTSVTAPAGVPVHW